MIITNWQWTPVSFTPSRYVEDITAWTDASYRTPTYLLIKTTWDLTFTAWNWGTNTVTFWTSQVWTFFQVPIRSITWSTTTATFEAYQ